MGKEDGGDALGGQLRDVGAGGFRYIIAQPDIVLVDLQTVLFQRAQIGIVARFYDVGIRRPRDQADLFMSQLHEVPDGQLEALLVVTADGSDVGIVFDVVVVEHGGDAGGAEFLHPGIQQRKPEDEGGPVALLHHEHAVGRLALEIHAHGDDIDGPALRLSHLLEAQDDIVAELVGRIAVHVFDDDAELAFPLLKTLIYITQLHGGLQDPPLHFVADVGGIVEAFGHGAFGNPQFRGNIADGGHGGSLPVNFVKNDE